MDTKVKKILLTGATGYIGSNLSKELYLSGYEVHIIIRGKSKLNLINEFKHNINIHVFDGRTVDLCHIISNINPDIAIHLASLFVGQHKLSQIENLIDSNILFATQVLESCLNTHVKYFINTGSQWQNYNGEDYNPVNLYAATKEAFENIANYYIDVSNMRMITLKLIDTYGPFDPRPKIINLLKEAYISGEKLEMSAGEQELGLLYIDDVVKAYLIAIEKIQRIEKNNHETFLVLPKEIYTLKGVVNIFQSVIGKNLNIEWGKKAYKDREMMKVYTKGKNILEGQETVSLYDGIKSIMNIEKIIN